MKCFAQILATGLGVLMCGGACADEIRISSAKQLGALAGTLEPGDEVILENGTYTDQHFMFKGEGTDRGPIVLKAERPGQVILNGSSRLSIAGSHLVLDGLVFSGGALSEGVSVIEFRDPSGAESHSCVLKNTVIENVNPEDPTVKYFWISVYGSGHLLEKNRISGQKHTGVTLAVRMGGEKVGHHVIRGNHFAGRPEGDGNGFETIRIGVGANREKNGHVVIEGNLFEDCNGEIEIASFKCNDNALIGNTFLRCKGSVTLRQGHRSRIVNNHFDGRGVEGTRALRITGDDNLIENNVFGNLAGAKGAVLYLYSGPPGGVRGGYAQVRRTSISKNLFAGNSKRVFYYSGKWDPENEGIALPEEVTIADNLLHVPEGAPTIATGDVKPGGIHWENNRVWGGDDLEQVPGGFTVVPFGEMTIRDVPFPVALTAKDVGPAWMK